MGCCQSLPIEKHPMITRSSTVEDDLGIVMKTKRRMKNVFNETLVTRESLLTKVFPKTPEVFQTLNQTLRDNLIFSCLNDLERKILIDAMEEHRVKAGEDVIKQGDEGDYFYVVERGNFSFLVDNRDVGQGHAGTCFGELALMYNTPRAATVRALTNATLWRLDRMTFRLLLAQNSFQQKNNIVEALSRVPLLQGLTNDQINLVADAVQIVKFQQGKQIIEKNMQGNIFYIIVEGQVQCTNFGKSNKYADLILGENDYFGERALLTGEPRAADVFAKTDVTLMALDREAFNQLLGPLGQVLDQNLGLRVLKTVDIFQNLSEREREKVVQMFQLRKFPAGKKIITQGKAGNTFYILKSGTCQVTKDNTEIVNLASGDYFGEMAILNDEPRQANVIAIDDVEVFELGRDQFNSVMGPLEVIMKRTALGRMESLLKATSTKNLRRDVQLDDLKEIGILGAGTFGRVTLVKHKKNGQTFALKAMIKYEIIRNQQQHNVVNEKNLMMQMDHPFILKLIATFHDSARIYLLLELVQGGELFTVIHTETRDGLNANDARFYGSIVMLALKHMHEKDIAYRDLKPENVLVDAQGYCRLADFGFAKLIESNRKTFTLCGTPEYLAPEIITQRGHNKAVDVWAFGILCYEMIAGFSPFIDFQNNDQRILYHNIMHGRLAFPKRFDTHCSDLVIKLLVRDPILRLGCSKNGFSDIMEHPWFQDTNWDALLNKEIQAPWVPHLKNEADTSNFDTTGIEVNQYAPDIQENWENEF